jgi:hypothetical protein
MVAAAIRTIFAQPDPAHVRSQLDEVAHMLTGQFPDVTALRRDAAEDLLAFTSFPVAHWRQTWSTNPLEPINGEIKRRTNVVGIFPNDAAIVRLVTAVLVETHDEWAVAERRYLSEESMAKLGRPPSPSKRRPSPSPPDTPTDVDDHHGVDLHHTAGHDRLDPKRIRSGRTHNASAERRSTLALATSRSTRRCAPAATRYPYRSTDRRSRA